MLSTDPLQSKIKCKVEGLDISSLKFSKLHSPKMKSVYWRYFGFPTNEDDRILTKQNVVCTVCNKILTNHGNTTNLRAHLQHRHKVLFKKLCSENGIEIPPRRPQTKNTSVRTALKREVPQQRVKIEYQDSSQDDSANITVDEEQSLLYETMVPMTYDDDEIIDAEQFAKVEVGGPIGLSSDDKLIESDSNLCNQIDSKDISNFRMDVIDEMHPYQFQDAIVNMIIQDLKNISILSSPGLSQLLRSFRISSPIPSEEKIATLISEHHSDKLTTLTDEIKAHSQTKPYSLGFEIWSNIEQKTFLSIYFNYTTDGPEYNLLNRLYKTIEYNKYTAIELIFEKFHLENCTAAIVSYEYDDYLKQFLNERNIPIILSYDVIVNKCLKNVFDIPEVNTVIEEVKDVIMRYTSEINSKDVEIPSLIQDFPWTYYELLKFFTDTVSWPDEVDVLVTTAKTISDILNILAMTLDTLKSEEIPHSSMLSPITSKILNNKLAISDNDDSFTTLIKTPIIAQLEKFVIADDHLTLSALLDPRFHRLTNILNYKNCIEILNEKKKKIFNLESCASVNNIEANNKSSISNSNKKSNLELFFDIQESKNISEKSENNNLENDIKRYRNEVYVSLDESPFLWWKKMGHLYGSLKHLACLYQCVPCVVNMNFKKPIKQQVCEFQNRFTLSGNLIDAILFLHDNFNGETAQNFENC